jgi:AraC family transcriptional regulator of adaptative response/methylated-DNA-[protein]-cysteine methyltransferase
MIGLCPKPTQEAIVNLAELQAAPDPLDDARWRAVASRDKGADGSFFFGVRTTGIYCRPGCASRTPRREHVRFFATPDEAERAGLRPCKRCTPRDAASQQAAIVARACALIADADAPPTLGQLADAVGMSPFHFHRLFKAATGLTPAAYARAQRAERLRDGLQRADSVTAAIYDAGYGSSSGLYGDGGAALGMHPATYRAGAPGERISYAIADSSLGPLLVAATQRGVCAIEFGASTEELRTRLAARFPGAELLADDPVFGATLAAVLTLVETPARGHELPLDIQGTAFQRRVWAALVAIPVGSTASYADVAAQIGQPGAARAVAGACAANSLAVAIPCHRVVRGDGNLSGYRWGTERKRILLERERAESCARTSV